MHFLCRGIPSLTCVLWDLERPFKDLGLSSHPPRGKREKGFFVVSGGVCCVLWTPLRWHLLSGSSSWESCRWEKRWIKAKWLIYLRSGLQGPSPAGSGAPVLIQLCHCLTAHQTEAGEPCLLSSQRFVSRLNQLGIFETNSFIKPLGFLRELCE